MILIKGKNVVLASALVLGFMSTQVVAANSTTYSITHVKQNDNLNVRAGAGVGNEVVTTIPFDGQGIQLLGDTVSIGKTQWVLVKWKGVTGWVSKYYLITEPSEVTNIEATKTDTVKKDLLVAKLETSENTTEEQQESRVPEVASEKSSELKVAETNLKQDETTETVAKQSPVKPDVWVLQCGNKTPYWKVELHPKWMNVFKGDYETGLPITKKKQERNRWNTALKTVVHGRNGQNNLKMTIKYAYSKRCYDTLSGLRVPYKVTTQFNGEELTGCCRAVKLDSANGETKLSMK